mmetsp:Transcript_72122/g.197442  ORF Transcript_72122/g.197442 Transcript_72122/m.197442 type:complete len:214 (-) Transcript_72122:229-870(-)|eukprot:6003871-Prymnesium_polylepis.3
MREASDRILAALVLEVTEQPQEGVLLREKERVEGLVLRQPVPLVGERLLSVLLAVWTLAFRRVDHGVHPPPVILEAVHLSLVVVDSAIDEGVDASSAIGLGARQLEDGELLDLTLILLARVPIVAVLLVLAEEHVLLNFDPLIIRGDPGEGVASHRIVGIANEVRPCVVQRRQLHLCLAWEGHVQALRQVEFDGLLENVVTLLVPQPTNAALG